MPGVMLFLIINILQCFVHNGLTDGICGITTLPCDKMIITRIKVLYPSTAVSLDFLNYFGNRDIF